MSVASEVKLSRQVRETIEAIDAIMGERGLQHDDSDDNSPKGVTIREVAARLKLDNSSARRRIRATEDAGLVLNVEKRPGAGRRALYRTVRDVSTEHATKRLLPTVEEIVQFEERQGNTKKRNPTRTSRIWIEARIQRFGEHKSQSSFDA
jgi:predicted ArsR family transcriptional regulator